MKLAFTADEYSWLARNISKLVKRSQNAVQITKTMELTSSLDDKLRSDSVSLDPKGNLVFNLNRNDLRILQGLVSNQRIVLMTSVIPGYKNRGAGYEDYIKQAESTVDLLTDVLEKVESAL